METKSWGEVRDGDAGFGNSREFTNIGAPLFSVRQVLNLLLILNELIFGVVNYN